MKLKDIKFKELAYKSTGPILEIGGGAYMAYGALSGDMQTFVEGVVAFSIGNIIHIRTNYVTERIDELNKRVSDLERDAQKAERGYYAR